jgi:hypothetical protein
LEIEKGGHFARETVLRFGEKQLLFGVVLKRQRNVGGRSEPRGEVNLSTPL